MVGGFNHNFRYKGELYHVQTEDSGLSRSQIITLLYRGGTILASKKTSYADITKVENLGQVVEDLMKEQHKEMLRRLKAGEFDAVIAARDTAAAQPEKLPVESPQPAAAEKTPVEDPAEPAISPAASEASPTATPETGGTESAPGTSLDDIILAYLIGGDKS